MAGEQTPLQREVSESKGTPESIRTETLRVLEQAQEILRIAEERGENVEEIRKEYKDVEQATIAALKNIRFDGRQARSEVSDDLSDGSIDEGEMGVIKDEYDEFFNLNLQAQTQVRTKEVGTLIKICQKQGISIPDNIEKINEEAFEMDLFQVTGIKIEGGEIIHIGDNYNEGLSNLVIYLKHKIEGHDDTITSLNQIFSGSLSAYMMGVYLSKIAQASTPEEYTKFFMTNLLPYIQQHKQSASLFLKAWGNGELGTDNIRSGLKRCEINEILPQIRQIEIQEKMEKIRGIAQTIYTGEGVEKFMTFMQREILEKKGMDACVVKYIDVFLKFDSTLDENLRQPGAKSLTKQQIELFIDGVLSYKKEEALKTGEEILNELGSRLTIEQLVNLEEGELEGMIPGGTQEQYTSLRTAINQLKKTKRAERNLHIIKSLNEKEYTELLKQYKNTGDPQEAMQAAKEAILKRKENELSGTSGYSPQVQSIQESGGGEYTITTTAGESIEVTEEEKKDIEDHPEALKNILNFRNIVFALNIPFVWTYRNDILDVMRQGDSTTIDSLDGNSIDSTELLKILNFTLKVIGEDGNFQSLSNAMGKIQSINGSGVDHGKIDTVTGLSVIGTRWKEKGYLRLNSGLSAINKTKLMESVYWKSGDGYARDRWGNAIQRQQY